MKPHMTWNLLWLGLISASPVAADEFTVTMSGAAYQPERISAAVGDTLRFVNDDGAAHNVFVPTAGHAVDLGKQEPGQETAMRLGKAGVFDVECVFHSGMLTHVEVK